MTLKFYDSVGREYTEDDIARIHAELNLRCDDANVERNVTLLRRRSRVGLKKYGMTTSNNPLSHREWLQHALEEALDMANYLQAAINQIDGTSNTELGIDPNRSIG